jgi:hypothetical protein
LSPDEGNAYVIDSPQGARRGTIAPVDLRSGTVGRDIFLAVPSPYRIIASRVAPIALVQGTQDLSKDGSDGGPDVLEALNLETRRSELLPSVGHHPLLTAMGVIGTTAYFSDHRASSTTLLSIGLVSRQRPSTKTTLGNAISAMSGGEVVTSSVSGSETTLRLWAIDAASGARKSAGTVTQPLGTGDNVRLAAVSENGAHAYVLGLQGPSQDADGPMSPTITRYTFSAEELGAIVDLADPEEPSREVASGNELSTHPENVAVTPDGASGYVTMSPDHAHPNGFLERVDFRNADANALIPLG